MSIFDGSDLFVVFQAPEESVMYVQSIAYPDPMIRELGHGNFKEMVADDRMDLDGITLALVFDLKFHGAFREQTGNIELVMMVFLLGVVQVTAPYLVSDEKVAHQMPYPWEQLFEFHLMVHGYQIVVDMVIPDILGALGKNKGMFWLVLHGLHHQYA